ncbi:3'-to-5' oligoribonuclease A [Helicobacter mustelae]|uniref:Outer membrane protein n=3 Tax=Helicobacter mustelae TaxID=217 RepID=D3UG11_HELM1|nr:outer membrane beta-barrel protein [Helicobacter mustelae]CBG39432.1 Putative hypothetical protein [Helicobacter mustelae 12198]SQH70944.1 3'-to-5' oligoribonuclease A [Helicobacter mustelae]STP12070.1 3'-to-5' oligoribonuclease A [Helicobacter mustelae]
MKRISAFFLMMFFGYAQNETFDESNMLLREEFSPKNIDESIDEVKKEIKERGEEPISAELARREREQSKSFYGKNGLFVGLVAGVGTVYNHYEDGRYNREYQVQGAQNTDVLKSPLNTTSHLPLFGGRIGYQNFFNDYFGTRIYADALIGSGSLLVNKRRVGSVSYMLGALNIDGMVDFPVSRDIEMGGYVGFGFGLMLLSDKVRSSALPSLLQTQGYVSKSLLWNDLLAVDYMVNVGVNLTLYQKHRIELGMKIPISQLLLGLQSPAIYKNQQTGQSKQLMSGDIRFSRSSFFIISYNYLF